MKNGYILWCTGWYTAEATKRIMKELKESGEYLEVQRASSIKDEYDNKRYYRIKVKCKKED